jgi:hypothetical protein
VKFGVEMKKILKFKVFPESGNNSGGRCRTPANQGRRRGYSVKVDRIF